jgi:hypothetical protein
VSWPKEDMFAVTVDGKILLNAHALDGIDLAKLVKKKGVFVGVVLTGRELRKLKEHVWDGCSEAAAYISGGRIWKRKRKRPSR